MGAFLLSCYSCVNSVIICGVFSIVAQLGCATINTTYNAIFAYGLNALQILNR